MNETEQTEQTTLQAFLMKLAAIAEQGGDVVTAIQRGDVLPPENVPSVTHGATGETLWERVTK